MFFSHYSLEQYAIREQLTLRPSALEVYINFIIKFHSNVSSACLTETVTEAFKISGYKSTKWHIRWSYWILKCFSHLWYLAVFIDFSEGIFLLGKIFRKFSKYSVRLPHCSATQGVTHFSDSHLVSTCLIANLSKVSNNLPV